MNFDDTFKLLDQMNETADRIVARGERMVDLSRQTSHAIVGECYIPVVKLPNKEDWKFVAHKNGVHFNLDGTICLGKCTVLAVF